MASCVLYFSFTRTSSVLYGLIFNLCKVLCFYPRINKVLIMIMIIIIIIIIIIAKLWSILELISIQNCVIQKLIKTNELISNEDLFKRLLRVAGFFYPTDCTKSLHQESLRHRNLIPYQILQLSDSIFTGFYVQLILLSSKFLCLSTGFTNIKAITMQIRNLQQMSQRGLLDLKGIKFRFFQTYLQ